MSNSESKAQLAERYLAALMAGDLQAVKRCLSPNVCIVEAQSLPYAGEWRGHEGYERFFNEVTTKYLDSTTIERNGICVDDKFAILYLTMSGTARKTGRPFTTEVAEVLEFENGLISKFKPFYWDTKAIAEAL